MMLAHMHMRTHIYSILILCIYTKTFGMKASGEGQEKPAKLQKS